MEDWQQQAEDQLLARWPNDEVLLHLKQQGCTPLVSENVLRKAKVSAKRASRIAGRQRVLFGTAQLLSGVSALIFAAEWHLRGPALFGVAALAFTGFVTLLSGLLQAAIG